MHHASVIRTALPITLSTLLIACGAGSLNEASPTADSGGDGGGIGSGGANTVGAGGFSPGSAPTLSTEPKSNNEPLYVFLFTHTEDHFNHALSEERYTRIAPMVQHIDEHYPDAHIDWTIQFQGADAKTVAERNDQTGIMDLLKQHAAAGRVSFGYHAHHDPTYGNRPIIAIDNDWAFGEIVDAVDEWVSCEKHPTMGGCVAPGKGGLFAVQDNFGPVPLVSGITLGPTATGMPCEDAAGRHALDRYLPERMLAFGITDHGPGASEKVNAAANQLMGMLTPSIETSGTVFWMNDVIRLNDGDRLNDVSSIGMEDTPNKVKNAVATLDRTRLHVHKSGIATKWIYTKSGEQSPTQYGYTHPQAPELPAASINSEDVINDKYDNTATNLEYLASSVFPQSTGSRFVGPTEVVDIVAPDDYRQVTPEELTAAALWIIEHTSDLPPSFASDGTEFYSLRDMVGLLSLALTGADSATITLPRFHGPREAMVPGPDSSVSATDLIEIAQQIADDIEAGAAAWQRTPPDILEGAYEVDGLALNTSQLLYGLAMLYASQQASQPLDHVAIPAIAAVPETIGPLMELGCINCTDSCWSLKPARIRLLN